MKPRTVRDPMVKVKVAIWFQPLAVLRANDGSVKVKYVVFHVLTIPFLMTHNSILGRGCKSQERDQPVP
jgi:hypothetical protein